MSSYVEQLLGRFYSKGILLDTNLLLLFLIGSYNQTLIGERGFKRVQQYTLEDFVVLRRLLAKFRNVVTTPHILTEVSNLAGQLQDSYKIGCFKLFPDTFRTFKELATESMTAARRSDFPIFGLTDCVIAGVATDYLVLTDDLPFLYSLTSSGIDALNFNHIRTVAWNI